jgi:hypothetical protein
VQAGIAAFTDEEEAGLHAVIVEARVVEITEHRLVGRMLHGEPVLRWAPGGEKKKDAKQPYRKVEFFRGNQPE